MSQELLLAMFNTVAPMVIGIIKDHKAKTGAEPTDEEIKQIFTANINKYLSEGAAWKATHPHQ